MSVYTLNLELNVEIYQKHIIDKRMEILRKLYNSLLHELDKRYQRMLKVENFNIKKNKEILLEKYGISYQEIYDFALPIQKHFSKNINMEMMVTIVKKCLNQYKKSILCDRKKHYIKFGRFNCFEIKANCKSFVFKNMIVDWAGLKLSCKSPLNSYQSKALKSKICYYGIYRRKIRAKNKYYLRLILIGKPPLKDKFNINCYPKSPVGIDIGNQTIAISTLNLVKLEELCSNINLIDKQIKNRINKYNRQKIINNQNILNNNVKTVRFSWYKSKKMKKTKLELAELHRKYYDLRKQSHEKLANYRISLGDIFFIEDMNFREVYCNSIKKYKKNKVNSTIRKSNLTNRSPSLLVNILVKKLSYTNKKIYKVNPFKVKASQYNHLTNKFEKKSLSERWNYFGGYTIQRDLYSAFLLMNIKITNLDEINRDLCIKNFNNFKKMHDMEIKNLSTSGKKLNKNFGIH